MCDAIWAGGIRCEGDSDTAYYTAAGAIALNKNDKDIVAEAVINMISSARREDGEFAAMRKTLKESAVQFPDETLDHITAEAKTFRETQKELAEMGKERPAREVEEEMKRAYKTAHNDMATRVAKLAGSYADSKTRERKYDSIKKNARRYSIVKDFKQIMNASESSRTEKILLTDHIRKEYGDEAAAKAYHDMIDNVSKEEATEYVTSGELAKAVKEAKANQRALNRDIAKAAANTAIPLEGKLQIAERVKKIYGPDEGARALTIVSSGEITLEDAHTLLNA